MWSKISRCTICMYRNLCMTWRWEMGDHAPASEARTRCDRKFRNVRIVYIEICVWHECEKWVITHWLQKQELEVIVHFEVYNLYTSTELEWKFDMYQSLYITWTWGMSDRAPVSETRTNCNLQFWAVKYVYIEISEM